MQLTKQTTITILFVEFRERRVLNVCRSFKWYSFSFEGSECENFMDTHTEQTQHITERAMRVYYWSDMGGVAHERYMTLKGFIKLQWDTVPRVLADYWKIKKKKNWKNVDVAKLVLWIFPWWQEREMNKVISRYAAQNKSASSRKWDWILTCDWSDGKRLQGFIVRSRARRPAATRLETWLKLRQIKKNSNQKETFIWIILMARSLELTGTQLLSFALHKLALQWK